MSTLKVNRHNEQPWTQLLGAIVLKTNEADLSVVLLALQRGTAMNRLCIGTCSRSEIKIVSEEEHGFPRRSRLSLPGAIYEVSFWQVRVHSERRIQLYYIKYEPSANAISFSANERPMFHCPS